MKTDGDKNIVDTEDAWRDGAAPRHSVEAEARSGWRVTEFLNNIYGYADLTHLQSVYTPKTPYVYSLSSVDELLERDLQREKDGFPRKIRIGKLVKPVRGGGDKVVIVPTTVEEKFIHDMREPDEKKEEQSGGSGGGEEGTVVGEKPIHDTDASGSGGAGQGESGEHDIESSAYDLGKILTEKFSLPNLKEKGKKRSTRKFSYELTDRHRGFGQVLDKKATLRRVIETNINLDRIPDVTDIDLTSLLVSPADSVYRILSRETDYESQALVFFVRDYSGSMSGKPTELIVAQHVFIYSWLLYQYNQQVLTRFILHDDDAKEVPDFYTYYQLSVAGGTRVASAYRLVNDIVEKESLERDYNIYVFQGTDGDDWDMTGENTLPELKKMLRFSNRIGITVAQTGSGQGGATTFEKYINSSQVLDEYPKQIRLDPVSEDADEPRLIEGIKRLIS
jgi:uncharacterized sporulation protein YeaH/YhbH (DUF444 family)